MQPANPTDPAKPTHSASWEGCRKPIAVVTTVGQLAEARALARVLVEEGLAACAQISEIESFYTWHGSLHHEREYRVVAKTTDDRYQAVEDAIRAHHSYELPAIHAFAFERVFPPYAEWIRRGTAPTPHNLDAGKDDP